MSLLDDIIMMLHGFKNHVTSLFGFGGKLT